LLPLLLLETFEGELQRILYSFDLNFSKYGVYIETDFSIFSL